MLCPKCQFENPNDAKFCIECASKMEFHCPNCETITPTTGRYCKECGYDLKKPKEEPPPINYSKPQSYTPKFLADKILTSRSSMEGERKLVTVLFADVANYTAISEKLDPEDVHQIMDGCFKILMDEIHKFEGTINQFTGDGVMALFGAPVAHEDHAQRACYSALFIQKTMQNYNEKIKQDYGVDFKMRIGLNSGPVVVATIGNDLRMDYTAIGDTTNLSARMESRAEPGSILISKATYRLAKNFFKFHTLGKIEFKGKEQPQEAYELIKAGEIETRIMASVAKGLTKFVGRKNSMAALKESYQQVLSGSGQVVGIVGEAGLGKSRLFLEFINQLSQGEYIYLEGRCQHYGSSMAYLPILSIVRSFFDIEEGDHDFTVKNKLVEKIRQIDERLAFTLPSFQELLSIKVDDDKYLQLDPAQKKIGIFEAIRDLFIRKSEQKPLVLAIEDLHWIDKTSEECISYLIDWLVNGRILIVLLYRLEYTHQWESKSYYTKISLEQLGTVSGSHLVKAILESNEVAPELLELILSRAGGNPLYVEELTQNLLENGLIDHKNHQYVLTREVTIINVPDTIQGIIAARIDRLEENIKQVILVASVIGREFAIRILQTVMGIGEELKSHLHNLQCMEFIYEKRLIPELEYIFKHALTQEVAYNSLLKIKKKSIHESIGQAIESLYLERQEEYYELLAYHFAQSDNKNKAFKYMNLANQKAARICAMEDAIKLFNDVMELLDTLADTQDNRERRISLLVNNYVVFQQLFKVSEYYDDLIRYESIAIGMENKGLLGAFLTRMAECEWWFGKYDQAKDKVSKGAKLCEAAGELKEAGISYSHLSWIQLWQGKYDDVIVSKKEALRLFEGQFNLYWYVWALGASSLAYGSVGRWAEALKDGLQALKVAKEYANTSSISYSAGVISIVYTWMGDLNRGLEYGGMSVDKAPTLVDKAWAQAALAWAWIRAGEFDRGIEVLENLIPLAQVARYAIGECYFSLFLGEGYCSSGFYNRAEKALEAALKVSERDGTSYIAGRAYRLLGEVALQTQPTLAAPYFEKSIEVLRDIKAENELALTYVGYGRLHKHKGQTSLAREYLTKALDIFERLGTLIEPEKIREILAVLPET